MSQQEEWKDVVPIPQDDGKNPVCPIAYTDEYREMTDYFRAVMASGEVSQRALKLSGRVIDANAAHYTAWVYRKKLVLDLGVDISEELAWVAEISGRHIKNYQLWHHREALLELLLDPKQVALEPQDQRMRNPDIRRELQFIDRVIDQDSKNFHAWSHRQWVVRAYGLWDQEMAFVDTQINQDVRNNSAWNQRYFALTRNQAADAFVLTKEAADAEIAYVIDKIKLAPNNESPWSYILGLLLRHAPAMLYEDLLPSINALASDKNGALAVVSTPFYWSALVDIYEKQAEVLDAEQRDAVKGLAREACESLAEQYDPVRAKYWKYRKQELTAQ
ncbi:CAAX geranylgeranyltransferase alpha subunit [Coemansia thaxteri]|uniref:Protein farnesyltransferase/geranylgeranyltransferase type-1 subunit alpha n=1 Tax=Coemansia thaxteri TaxID=2663907 RepID=A0A9W8EDC3_9FUNG|nr:CAAX geranylgeranyltransferase alpha subunit [Coemansia thaxteri]KAJ2003555.1 CAAX geranylgeranyltransferase alpha subunit [Coemansia thaxteri]KAJ2470810.1 CAAX geranylgeranyltransferase alpha subunit [Coemansia sp. RSA 2322]KAJ2481817.1 CAAX geranylgeranyltransferase alpha subunit [Coemansia sp. RSA 2320]